MEQLVALLKGVCNFIYSTVISKGVETFRHSPPTFLYLRESSSPWPNRMEASSASSRVG